MDDLYVSLYEHVESGVLRTREGAVRFCNPAARRLLGCEAGQRLRHPLLREMSTAAARGLVSLPSRFRISLPGVAAAPGIHRAPDAGALDVVIASAPWYDNEVLVLLSRPAGQLPEGSDAALLGTVAALAADLRAPLEELALREGIPAAGLHGASQASRPDIAALLHSLGKVEDYVNLLAEPCAQADQRMLVRPLLIEAIDRTAVLALAHDVAVRVIGSEAASPVVYGNASWLARAVEELIEHAIRVAPIGSLIDTCVQAVGTRAQVRIRLAGGHGNAATGWPVASHASRARTVASASTGIAISRHVAEQHGGSIRIESEFGVDDIVLDLPAGAPATGAVGDDTRLALEQAARFERSLGALEAHSSLRAADESDAAPR